MCLNSSQIKSSESNQVKHMCHIEQRGLCTHVHTCKHAAIEQCKHFITVQDSEGLETVDNERDSPGGNKVQDAIYDKCKQNTSSFNKIRSSQST